MWVVIKMCFFWQVVESSFESLFCGQSELSCEKE